MIRTMISIKLNAQSVCTYQLWSFLIVWCSTRLEDSKHNKIIIFGCTEKRYELNSVIEGFDSIWKWIQINYWNYGILLHHWILLIRSFPETSYLYDFELRNSFFEFLKFVLFSKNLNSRTDQNWLCPVDWVDCWCHDDVRKVNRKIWLFWETFYMKVVDNY
jgi:hypothetical protein